MQPILPKMRSGLRSDRAASAASPAPMKISVNYVSAGDYVADNISAAGRAQNRRVDIQVFNR